MSVTNQPIVDRSRKPHIVIIDAYDGFLEYLSDTAHEIEAAQALGLPLNDLADGLDCRITRLDWREWLELEQRPDSFLRWMPFPATRPTSPPSLRPYGGDSPHPQVAIASIPAHDPDHRRPFAEGPSPLSYGLLANSDPLFIAAYVLAQYLEELHARDPIAAVILPMWGGCGYVAQMARATGVGLQGVPFAVVVTGTSAQRQAANGEGMWTRPAITRRQMEDLSLALADLVIGFGGRGQEIARQGRPGGTFVLAPRAVTRDQIERVEEATRRAVAEAPLHFFLHEPLQPASGALLLLDAVQELRKRGIAIGPVSCSGPDMCFAPQKPRDFKTYWSSRGWVRELIAEGRWQWQTELPPASCPVRLYPSLFEHLPSIAEELAKGHFVLLSPAAAEGLAPGQELPPEVLLPSEPTPATLADKLAELHAMGWAKLEQARKALCAAVFSAERGPERQRRLDQIIGGLSNLINGDLARPSLASAARLLLDRKRPLAEIASPPPAAPVAATLTVAVICHEMGSLLAETMHSVWNAARLPDEVILVDDGSYGDETLATIAALETEARQGGLPLRVIRQTNQGLAAARNAALAAASGGYISFTDGDDLIEPDFYGAALETLQANPGLGGVAAWAITFGDGVPPGFWNAPQAELPLLFVENTIFVPCMMPTELVRELGGYDVTQRFNYEDWELSVRLLARGWPIVTIPRYMQRYRVRADSLLRTMSDVQNQVMRELFLTHHRDAAERFAPEIAMQIEHQLMKLKEEHAALQRRQTVVEQLKPVVRTTRARLFRGLARFKGASGS
jgi:hypothetical protein